MYARASHVVSPCPLVLFDRRPFGHGIMIHDGIGESCCIAVQMFVRLESKLVAKGDGWSWMIVALLISRSVVAWMVVLTIAVTEWL